MAISRPAMWRRPAPRHSPAPARPSRRSGRRRPRSQAVAVGLLAGLADRHDDAAPIGVARRERGLDQRRIADREPDAPRRPRRRRAGHLDGDEFLRALAVAHDLLRQVDHHRVERAAEIAEPAIARARHAAGAAPCRSRTAARVSLVEVSPSTVIAVERALGRRAEQRLQHRRRQRRVGEDIGQHRRHVGRDHARALGEAVDGAPRRRRSSAVAVAPLGKVSVVMIARAAFAQRLGRRQRRRRAASAADDLLAGQRLADHAGRGDVDLAAARSRRARAAARAVVSTTSVPARPVKTLALPELTTIAARLAARQAVAAPDRPARPASASG